MRLLGSFSCFKLFDSIWFSFTAGFTFIHLAVGHETKPKTAALNRKGEQ